MRSWLLVRPPSGSRFIGLLVLIGLCLSGSTCSWRDDLDGERRRPEGLSEAPIKVQASTDLENVAIDLFASRPLASGFRQGSLIIDASTPDFVKYVDGGMRQDWERGVPVPGDTPGEATRTASLVRGLAAQIHFPFDVDPGGIAVGGESLNIRFTAKSAVDKQLVSIFLNEHKLGDLSMPSKAWQSYSIRAPRSVLLDGENKLRFYFRTSSDIAGHRSAAAFARFAIGEGLSDDAAFVSAPYDAAGQSQPALLVKGAGRISYYLRVPAHEPRLEFDVAGSGGYRVVLRAAGKAAHVALSGKAETAWQAGSVDLRSYQGQVVRLDFVDDGTLAWGRPRILQAARSAPERSWSPPRRVLLLSVSSLRSDRLRLEVGHNMRRFLEEGFGVLETQASVPSASGAHASAMSGRLSPRNHIDEQVTTTAEALRTAGFTTALVSGNGFVSDEAGFAQGFGYYDNPMRRQHHAGAKTLWRQAKRFLLEHRNERVFIHITAVEPHLPYRPSDEALAKEWALAPLFAGAKTISLAEQVAGGRRVATAQEQAFVRSLYDATISDVDSAFAEILSELAELDLEGETAIILAGDHGEELFERGRFGHSSSLKQEALQTPLAIQYSGLDGVPEPRLASSADLHATILDLVGAAPDSSAQGMSLLSGLVSLDERPFFSGLSDGSRSLRLGRYKLIQPIGGELELFDLQTDPGEQKDRAHDLPVVVRTLRNVLATGVAYEDVWSTSRWGQASSPLEAFARDQGM